MAFLQMNSDDAQVKGRPITIVLLYIRMSLPLPIVNQIVPLTYENETQNLIGTSLGVNSETHFVDIAY